MNVTCEYCGKECERAKSQIERAAHIFCSRECHYAWIKKTGFLKNEAHPGWNSVLVKCEYCGKPLWRPKWRIKNYKHQFCSNECFGNWIRESGVWKGRNSPGWSSVLTTCESCGASFWQTKSTFEHVKHHFCSKECKEKGHSIELKCEFCGRTFKKYMSAFLVSTHYFCSQECYHRWTSEEGILLGEKNPHWNSLETTCDYCGKPFFRSVSNINSAEHHFCSQECSAMWVKETGAYRGENSPLWKGGISYEPYCIKFDEERKEKVREKYGRRCFLCRKTEKENGRKLPVHHVDYDKEVGCNGKKWLLVPLCDSCHSKTNYNCDYWENLIRAKMRKRKLSHSQIILDVFF